MERDFDLLGITAVEDKIQIGVPETAGHSATQSLTEMSLQVKMLLAGGIRVWMLTGRWSLILSEKAFKWMWQPYCL